MVRNEGNLANKAYDLGRDAISRGSGGTEPSRHMDLMVYCQAEADSFYLKGKKPISAVNIIYWQSLTSTFKLLRQLEDIRQDLPLILVLQQSGPQSDFQ